MKMNQKMNQKLEGALGSLRRVQSALRICFCNGKLRCHLVKSYLWVKPLRHLVINPLHLIVISLSAKKKTTLLRS